MYNEIIKGVYISNYVFASNLDMLKQLNITHIVNCSQLNNLFPDVFKYLKIDINDDINEDISQYFHKTSKFIKNALNKGNVLIHCIAGKSRSPTIIISFLCKKEQYKLKDAIELVKSKRLIDINEGFYKQLIHSFN